MTPEEFKKEYDEDGMYSILQNAVWRAYLDYKDTHAEQAKVYLDLFHLLNDNKYEINFVK